jgi:uncharacterized protein (TIGR02145 family)
LRDGGAGKKKIELWTKNLFLTIFTKRRFFMGIKKSLIAGSIGILGISLLFTGVSCNKGNPVNNNNNGTITDADGNIYQTIKIGNQVWMAENLRTTKYNDGTAIPLVTDSAAWHYRTTPSYCYYSNTTNADSIKEFGALYNWYTVDTKKLAPAGWHVPSDSEWTVLKNYLVINGYNWDGTTDTATYNKIAKSLASKTDWATSISAGAIGNDLTKNNSSGFSALPGGCRDGDGGFGTIGDGGDWWSATADGVSSACVRGLAYDGDNLVRGYSVESCGFSVRLVRD